MFPAFTSGQSMLPPKAPGTIVDRASPIEGATPRHPRNGARGTSHACLPSPEVVRATPFFASTSYRQTASGGSGPSIAVRSVPFSAPKPGKDAEMAHGRAGSSLRIRIASVSPGSAPSTKNGPVCGLSCPGGTTFEGRSAVVFTAPSKQSSVHATMRVPGLTR